MSGQETRSTGSRVTRRRFVRAGSGLAGAAAVTGVGAASDGELVSTDPVPADEPGPQLQTLAAGPDEVRAVHAMPKWYWDGASVARSRLRMREWLDRAEEAGLNVIFAWIESDGLASLLGEPAYAESDGYDFWNPDRGWDPLGELIAGAEARAMEVHLWYSFTRYKRSSLRIPEYNPDLEVLPPGDPDWASIRLGEYEQGYRDPSNPMVDGESICTSAFDAHDWTIEVLDRAFERYPGLGGLHVEEPGYLADDRCVCPRCQDLYADLHDDDPANLLAHTYRTTGPYYDDDRAVEVRTHGTDAFVAALHDWWTGRDGGALSFNGSWTAKWDRVRGRNWAHWSEQGWMPYYFPQLYTGNLDEFTRELEATMETVGDTVVAPLLGVRWADQENDAMTVADQIERARAVDGHADAAVGGTALFSGGALTPGLTVGLRARPYTRSAAPRWRASGDADQDRGDASLADLRARDAFAFTPHWRDGDAPGSRDPAPSITSTVLSPTPDGG